MANKFSRYGITDPNFQNFRPEQPGESPEDKARLDKLWETSGAYFANIQAEQAAQAGRQGSPSFAVAGPESKPIEAKFQEGRKSYLAGLPDPTATSFVRPEAWDTTTYNANQYDPDVLNQIKGMLPGHDDFAAANFAESVLGLKPGMPMPAGDLSTLIGQRGFGPPAAVDAMPLTGEWTAGAQAGTDWYNKEINRLVNEEGMSFGEAERELGQRGEETLVPFGAGTLETRGSEFDYFAPGEDEGALVTTDSSSTESDYIPSATELEQAIGDMDIEPSDFDRVLDAWTTNLKNNKYGTAKVPGWSSVVDEATPASTIPFSHADYMTDRMLQPGYGNFPADPNAQVTNPPPLPGPLGASGAGAGSGLPPTPPPSSGLRPTPSIQNLPPVYPEATPRQNEHPSHRMTPGQTVPERTIWLPSEDGWGAFIPYRYNEYGMLERIRMPTEKWSTETDRAESSSPYYPGGTHV